MGIPLLAACGLATQAEELHLRWMVHWLAAGTRVLNLLLEHRHLLNQLPNHLSLRRGGILSRAEACDE
jgi:hypothetical protein